MSQTSPRTAWTGQTLDVVYQAVTRERFQRFHNARMQRPSPLLRQTAVRHFVRQRMLEGIGVLREEVGLIQELGGLEVPEAVVHGRLRQFDDSL